jgi:predicted 2-oxoglutarate/Fe(II)-dependent dioxygenase YbiX
VSGGAWPLPPLGLGDSAPGFVAASRSTPRFHFSTLPGRYVVLAFLPDDRTAWASALSAFERRQARFDGLERLCLFLVKAPDGPDVPADVMPGQRWFFDPDGEVARLYGALDDAGTERPFWLLVDPMLRVMDKAPLDEAEAFWARVDALPPADQHAGVPLVAPVAIVPRAFEPDLCRRLIACYEAEGGAASGVMRDIGGKTVAVLDGMKRRRDVMLTDGALRQAVIGRISNVLAPEISKVFQFQATRIERYLVACYDAVEGGYFRPHRDNETFATAHRRFAVSINLNAEEFEGGDLRFPEFGRRTYRPPTGGAVVFCCSLQHEATPVTKGRRYAFLPFVYDAEGQAIRDRNASFLDTGPARVADGQ